jgi:hypothetical protein
MRASNRFLNHFTRKHFSRSRPWKLSTALVVFLSKSYLKGWHLDSSEARTWDIILKTVAGYIALAGALITVLKYIDEKVHATEIARRESKKEFSEKQQQVYFRLLRATATIATEKPGAPDRLPAEDVFWRLYWGEIIMVEDDGVAKEVDAFSNVLYDTPLNEVG